MEKTLNRRNKNGSHMPLSESGLLYSDNIADPGDSGHQRGTYKLSVKWCKVSVMQDEYVLEI